MAHYLLHLRSISRGAGRSAIALAAYISGSRLTDERTGEVFNFQRKRDVLHSQILTPGAVASGLPPWVKERERLWNQAEKAERRQDARVAAECLVRLPDELAPPSQVALACGFAQQLADRYGCAIDLAVHVRPAEGERRNPHAHLAMTTRRIEASGFAEKALPFFGSGTRVALARAGVGSELQWLRSHWAAQVNDALAAAGLASRVDHRSLEAQGVHRPPWQWLRPYSKPRLASGTPSHALQAMAREREALARTYEEQVLERVRIERETRGINAALQAVAVELHRLRKLRPGLVVAPTLPAYGRDNEASRREAAGRWLANRERWLIATTTRTAVRQPHRAAGFER